MGNVHEIAHQASPAVRVAYVDFEPVADAREIVADLEIVTVTRADLRDVASALSPPEVADPLDFTRPTALLAVAVLHFVPEDLPDTLARYRAALVPAAPSPSPTPATTSTTPRSPRASAPASRPTALAPPR